MNTRVSTILAIGGLAMIAGAARAQYDGDPGLDLRILSTMQPPVHVDFRCDAPSGGGATDSAPTVWTGGIVPFEIDGSVSDPALTIRAMELWMYRQTMPNVTFVRRDPANPAHNNYVRVLGINGPVSDSQVGMKGGMQLIHQGTQVNDYVMAHEFGHALGFWHEHTRPDRDNYIWVYYDRVSPSAYQSNFNIAPDWVPNSLNTGYDFDSVMHYGATSFMNPSCDSGLATCISVLTCTPLVARSDLGYGIYQCTMGQQTHLSINDVDDMINVYGVRQRQLWYVGPNASTGGGTLTNPFSSPAYFGGGGDVYFQGGSSYHVQAGTVFSIPGTWRKHAAGSAVISSQ